MVGLLHRSSWIDVNHWLIWCLRTRFVLYQGGWVICAIRLDLRVTDTAFATIPSATRSLDHADFTRLASATWREDLAMAVYLCEQYIENYFAATGKHMIVIYCIVERSESELSSTIGLCSCKWELINNTMHSYRGTDITLTRFSLRMDPCFTRTNHGSHLSSIEWRGK